MASNENKPYSLERIVSHAHNICLRKLCSGVTYGAAACIYKPITVAAMELSSPQYILLALLYSLVIGDVMSCLLLAQVCQQVQQLRSKYLKVWLVEDFAFPRQDMEKAMTRLAELITTGVIMLPPHVTEIMSSIATKYGITGLQLMSTSEEYGGNLAIEMEKAVSNNNPGDIITLVTAGGDVNGLTQSGESLLHMAARTGNCAAITVLGFLKADLEIVNSTMATPLEIAIRNNDVQSVRALIAAGAKTDKQLLRGNTYLHIAAAGSHNGALLALLDAGLELNVKNHLGETPLFQAVRANNVCGAEILLERRADISLVPEGSKTLVEIVVDSQNVAMFKVLTKVETLPAYKFKDGNSLLHLVANSGNAGMLKLLKDQSFSANIKNNQGNTPLHVASDLSVVRILLQMGLLIDAKDNTGSTALISAVKNSKLEISNFLLYSGSNANSKDTNNMAPLHYAAKTGNVTIIKALLEAGAKVEEKNNNGETPAFIAAVNNQLNALELLVEYGADLTLKNSNGEGMIHLAACSGHSEIVSSLLGSGVTVDMKGKGDRTALHYAAEKGHTSVVSVLLNRGADVKALTNIDLRNGGYHSHDPYERWTPLIAASKAGHLDVVKLLVEEGAPINDKDNVHKKTALGWALNNKRTSVADYLRSEGGCE